MQVKKEIETCDAKEKCVVFFMSLPCFPGGQLAYFLLVNDQQIPKKIIARYWDSEFDTNRFKTDVYNLSRLCIKEEIKELTDSESLAFINELNNFEQLPQSLNKKDGILLDGVDYELRLNTNKFSKQYNWKIANEELKIFEPLIKMLCFTDV